MTTLFRDTVVARAKRDPAFACGLLTSALECVNKADLLTAAVLLSDAVEAYRLADNTGEKQRSRRRTPIGELNEAGFRPRQIWASEDCDRIVDEVWHDGVLYGVGGEVSQHYASNADFLEWIKVEGARLQ